MPRAVFAVLQTALVVLTAAASFAQDKKDDKKDDKPPTNLFPLAKGGKWEYEVTAPGSRGVSVATVTAVSEPAKGEQAVATVTTILSGKTLTEELSADDKGVYRHSAEGQKFDPPVQILQYPYTAGATWTAKIKVSGQEATAEFKADKPRKEKVKAADYTVYPVEMTLKVSGQTVTATTWYADGVGVVKQEMSWGLITSTTELIKFTPAGK